MVNFKRKDVREHSLSGNTIGRFSMQIHSNELRKQLINYVHSAFTLAVKCGSSDDSFILNVMNVLNELKSWRG